MTTMTLAGRLLAADTTDRTLEYLILPFGEEGRTNLGRVRASAGVLELPTNPADLVLNLEHDRVRPVGRGVTLVETPEGLRAKFDILPTTAGDDLLIEAKAGVRAGASVEIDDTAIRGGQLMAGRLTAVAAVTTPAFPSATLTAADCGDLPATPREDTTMADQVTPEKVDEEIVDETIDTVEDDTEEEKPALAAARAPLGVQAPTAMTAVKERKHSILTASQMLADIAGKGGIRNGRLAAALSEIASADTLEITTPESFEGKIWQGRRKQRKFIQLTQTEGLTKLKYKGWKFADGETPAMASYAGFPAEPPSGPVSAEETTWEPGLVAWAGTMDRKHRDFSDPDFWNNFLQAVGDSYSEVTDSDHLDALWTAAAAVTPSAAAKPSGVADGAYQLVKGALAVLPKGVPTFAVIALEQYEEMLYTFEDKVMPYLKMALRLESGEALDFSLVPTDELTDGQVLVGCKEAAVHRELPGASPIRIDAEVISKGGFEQGFFGYAGTEVFEPAALAKVTLGA